MRFWLRTLAWLAVMCAGMELLCRLGIGTMPRLRVDPRFDKITVPHQVVVQSFEGFSRGRTNAQGNLDAEVPSPPPRDGILVVGDSYTEARQVARDERFTDRLGALLHRRVYNAGHAGWSPLNSLGYLQAEGATFQAASAVVQVSGNDLGDLVAKKRAHVVETDGVFTVEWPNRGKPGTLTRARSAAQRSAFAGQLISSAVGMLAGKEDDDAAVKDASCATPDPRAVRALPWLFGELARAHRDVRILYLPRLEYHGGCVDKCAPARALYADAAARAKLPFVDPTAAMCARFAATHQPLNGFWNTIPGTGHMNADGHAIVARELATSFEAR